MSDEAEKAIAQEQRPGGRLAALGYEQRDTKRRKPETLRALTPRMRLMIELMVHGSQHDWIEKKMGIARGTPLTLVQAADAVGIRRRNARDLFNNQAVFKKELASQIQSLRDGAKVNAVRTIIELIDEKGDNKAADRKVRLEAAQIISGDAVKAGSPSVNVHVTNQISPGYVIRLPPRRTEPQTIEGEVVKPLGVWPSGVVTPTDPRDPGGSLTPEEAKPATPGSADRSFEDRMRESLRSEKRTAMFTEG